MRVGRQPSSIRVFVGGISTKRLGFGARRVASHFMEKSSSEGARKSKLNLTVTGDFTRLRRKGLGVAARTSLFGTRVVLPGLRVERGGRRGLTLRGGTGR